MQDNNNNNTNTPHHKSYSFDDYFALDEHSYLPPNSTTIFPSSPTATSTLTNSSTKFSAPNKTLSTSTFPILSSVDDRDILAEYDVASGIEANDVIDNREIHEWNLSGGGGGGHKLQHSNIICHNGTIDNNNKNNNSRSSGSLSSESSSCPSRLETTATTIDSGSSRSNSSRSSTSSKQQQPQQPQLSNNNNQNNNQNKNDNQKKNNSTNRLKRGSILGGFVRSVFSSPNTPTIPTTNTPTTTTSPTTTNVTTTTAAASSSPTALLHKSSNMSHVVGGGVSSSVSSVGSSGTDNNNNSVGVGDSPKTMTNSVTVNSSGEESNHHHNSNNVVMMVSSSSGSSSSTSSDAVIPLMFSHRIYRYHWRVNMYEMVADEYNITGWRHVYIAIQNGEEMICVSERSGCVYRKILRTSLTRKVSEEESFIVASDRTDWNDTRVLLYNPILAHQQQQQQQQQQIQQNEQSHGQMSNELLFIKSNEIVKLDLVDYTFSTVFDVGVGNWKKNVFVVIRNRIYGVDISSMNVCCFNLETRHLSVLNSSRDWTDTAGMVLYNGDIILFTNSGMFKMDPTSGRHRPCTRVEAWSMYSGCVAKVSDHSVLFISSGNLYVWDLATNKYELLSRSWKICHCIATVKPIDVRDRNFLKTGSSLKGE